MTRYFLDWNAPVTQRVREFLLPDAPAGLEVVSNSGTLRLVWQAPPQHDIEKYNVWQKGFLGSKILDSTEDTEYEPRPGDIGKTANLYVTAVDRDGLESVPSEIVLMDTRVVAP